jgi:hypothetical protein
MLALLAVGCTGVGGRAAPDDAGVHQALLARRSGAEVTFDGRVAGEPRRVGGHEHLLVTDPAGDRLEVDHNIDLSEPVPAHRGDQVIIHGQLYVDPGRAGVHCTHSKTSRGCPVPGWIEYRGAYYE